MAGGRKGQGARKENGDEGPSLAITPIFCLEFACVLRLSVSIRKVAGEHLFCVLIYMNSYIFYKYFILSIFLYKTYLIFDFECLTLSLVYTNEITKYARTYIRRYAHTHTHTKTKKVWGKKKVRTKKEMEAREERRERKEEGQQEKKETKKRKKRE